MLGYACMYKINNAKIKFDQGLIHADYIFHLFDIFDIFDILRNFTFQESLYVRYHIRGDKKVK